MNGAVYVSYEQIDVVAAPVFYIVKTFTVGFKCLTIFFDIPFGIEVIVNMNAVDVVVLDNLDESLNDMFSRLWNTWI